MNTTSTTLEEIENTVVFHPLDQLQNPDIIAPERTIIKWAKRGIQIYKVCYLERVTAPASLKKCINPKSLCKERCNLVKNLILLSQKRPESDFASIISVFNWIDEGNFSHAIYSEQGAIEVYKTLSNELYSEAKRSSIKKSGRSRSTLSKIQKSAILVLSTSGGITPSVIESSSVKIERITTYQTSQKRPINEAKIRELWTLNLRHFDTIADHLLNNKASPLVIKRNDIGYEDYKMWTGKLDTIKLAKWKAKNSENLYLFDKNDQFILDPEEAKERQKALGIYRFTNKIHRMYIDQIKADPLLDLTLFRRTAGHFAHLLLMVSGCNPEQLQHIDFSKKLTNTLDAKRQAALKPRAGYKNKPIQFSAKFLPVWRKYVEVRSLTIKTYDPNFGKYGIPVAPAINRRNSQEKPLKMGSSATIVEINSLGFPEGIKNPPLNSGRDFKTINFLELTGGDIPLVSKVMDRDPQVTRNHYSYKSFEDSAKELDNFFNALIESASIKGQNYSPSVPIIMNGKKIHTGRCNPASNTPKQIQGVTDNAPEPSCGAPVTCLFCKNYGIHAEVDDIKLILSAKAWLKRQTRAISRHIDEHASKFLPLIERIDDIIDDFIKQSEENANIYNKAFKEISAGNYSKYWRNKIDALLSGLEA